MGLQQALFDKHGILMIALPPYHPDYNPTELVFSTLLARLCSEHAIYNSMYVNNFKDAILKYPFLNYQMWYLFTSTVDL